MNKVEEIKKSCKFSLGFDKTAKVRIHPLLILDIIKAMETYKAGLQEYAEIELSMFPEEPKKRDAEKIIALGDKLWME